MPDPTGGPTPTRQAPPAGGRPREFVLPPTEEFTLPNGLGVTLVPWGSVPKATVNLSVRVGNLNEGAGAVWLADLWGDLLQEGSASRTGQEVAEAAARMGGSLGVGVGADQSSVGGDVLAEFAADMVRLVADVIRRPRFPAGELPRLRQDRLRQLAVARQQPGQLALARFREALYGEHPYGRVFPTEAMLEGFTLEQVRAFHEANVGAARARLYVAGRFDAAAVRAAVAEALGDWAPGPAPAVDVPAVVSRRETHLVDRPGAPQSTLYVGVPVAGPDHPDWIALQVTNSLLGGSFASRITSNIREDKGYTYSPQSSLSARYRDAYWLQQADVATEVTGAALGEILHEIERLAAQPPPAAELAGIQAYLAGTFVLQNSSRHGLIGQKRFLDLHGLPDDYLTGFVPRIHAVSPGDVSRITARYLQPGHLLVVVVGDRARVEPQLAPRRPAAP